MGVTPDGKEGSFLAVTIISVISCPVTVTRLIAESPPTFTVWHPRGPAPRGIGVDDGAGSGSSALPDPSVEAGAGVGEEVRVGVGEEVMVGVGEEVRVGIGEGVMVGVGEEVRVGVGEGVMVGVGEEVRVGVGEGVMVGVGEEVRVGTSVGEVVGTVVSGATTVINPSRFRTLITERF